MDKNIKISPHSEEAESAVLGCMLINDEAANKVIQILNTNDFYIKKNKIIYDNIIQVFNNNNNALAASKVLIRSADPTARRSPNKIDSRSILISKRGMNKTPKPSVPASTVFIIASLSSFFFEASFSAITAPINPLIIPPNEGSTPIARANTRPGTTE